MSDARDAADSSTSTPRTERVFVDAEGVRWRVYEQPFSEYDRRSGQSLIFASDAAIRRVRNYPPTWAEISDAELALLSWRA